MTRLIPAATTDKPALRSLLDAYIVEFNQHTSAPSDYPFFDAYWQEPGKRWPYLIQAEDRTIGFAMINTWSSSGKGTDFSVAEFYIVPKARHGDHGRHAALAAFKAHPGNWEVSVAGANSVALQFWEKVLADKSLLGLSRTKDSKTTVFRFHT